jgi:hypothetical protein
VYTRNGNTLVNVPATAYNVQGPESEGFIVEVYPDRVMLKGRNFKSKQWVSTACYTIQVPPSTLQPSIYTLNSNYTPGHDITIHFSNGPGNPGDWIGLYSYGDDTASYKKRLYVNGFETATTGNAAGSVTFRGGLIEPGTYSAKFFMNNEFTEICRDISFVVAEPRVPSVSIISKWSDLAMDLFSGKMDDDAAIGQWPSHNGNNQKWKIIPSSDEGYKVIVSAHSNKCLDVLVSEGTYYVVQKTINHSDSQKWKLIQGDNGSYIIVSKEYNMAIDIENKDKVKGA